MGFIPNFDHQVKAYFSVIQTPFFSILSFSTSFSPYHPTSPVPRFPSFSEKSHLFAFT